MSDYKIRNDTPKRVENDATVIKSGDQLSVSIGMSGVNLQIDIGLSDVIGVDGRKASSIWFGHREAAGKDRPEKQRFFDPDEFLFDLIEALEEVRVRLADID